MNRAGRPPRELAGQRFGRLVARERAGRDDYGNASWRCDCDCGSSRVIAQRSLVTGRATSCGCYARELGGGAPRLRDRAKWFAAVTARVLLRLQAAAPNGMFVRELADELEIDATRIAIALRTLAAVGVPLVRHGRHGDRYVSLAQREQKGRAA